MVRATKKSDLTQIREHVDSLRRMMSERGLYQIEAHLMAKEDGSSFFISGWKRPYDEVRSEPDLYQRFIVSRYFKCEGDDFQAAFEAALAFVAALPKKEDTERDVFLDFLARATEYGRRVGIDDEFVNPLAVLAKKLSENAITGPKS